MRAMLIVGLVLISGAALAEVDRPVSTRIVNAAGRADPHGELRCTRYPDLVVRESGIDTPAPGPPAILPAGAACNGAASGVALGIEGFSLAGRKGPFLLFTATDPNGATPFIVTTAAGRELYRDALIDRLRTVGLQDGALRLGFVRGLNGGCSILAGGPDCWAKIAREGQVPASVAMLPPPRRACTAAYAKGKAPAGDPSIVTYPVEMTIGQDGRSEVLSAGALGCLPLP